jgi:flagellar biosynthesis GTPase FlhF
VPEHIRALTSQRVLDVEAEVSRRLSARAAAPVGRSDPTLPLDVGARTLDAGQAAVVDTLVGDRPLVVVEGAAGAGKTTTLAATRHRLERQGRRLTVVTPTLKAAKVRR